MSFVVRPDALLCVVITGAALEVNLNMQPPIYDSPFVEVTRYWTSSRRASHTGKKASEIYGQNRDVISCRSATMHGRRSPDFSPGLQAGWGHQRPTRMSGAAGATLLGQKEVLEQNNIPGHIETSAKTNMTKAK